MPARVAGTRSAPATHLAESPRMMLPGVGEHTEPILLDSLARYRAIVLAT
jgi:hypothetical protein